MITRRRQVTESILELFPTAIDIDINSTATVIQFTVRSYFADKEDSQHVTHDIFLKLIGIFETENITAQAYVRSSGRMESCMETMYRITILNH